MGKTYRRLHLALIIGMVYGFSFGCELLTPRCDDKACELPTGATEVDAEACETLGQDCFRMAVIGDSIAWGNGLEECGRYWSKLTETIEGESGKQVYRQVYAYTRAKLGEGPKTAEECRPNETGEVPKYRASVFEQIDFINDLCEQDLILVSGCINDVDFTTVIDPLTTVETLDELVVKFCLNSMRELLDELRIRAPNARVIVLGYYPILSEDSFDLPAAEANVIGLFTLFGVPFDPSAPLISTEVTSNPKLFDERSRTNLQQAVADANSSGGGDTMIAFANPGYKPENAMFGPQPWLFGFDSDWECDSLPKIGLDLYPKDTLAKCRIGRCFDALLPSVFDLVPVLLSGDLLQIAPDLVLCIWGSVGHPNQEGEDAYFEAVRREWRGFSTPTGAPVACP